MKIKKYLKQTKLFFLGFFLGYVLSCSTIDIEQQDLIYMLQTSFDKIYLAKYGLEYPHTREALDRCVQYNDSQCLITYEQVLQGKKTISSHSGDKALAATLDIIERTCLSKYENIANFSCYGGIMSLYYYDTPEQDAVIRARIKKYPRKVRNKIFNNEFYWYHNRPNFKAWIEDVTAMDIDWEDSLQKENISSLFKKRIEAVDDEPWVLRARAKMTSPF